MKDLKDAKVYKLVFGYEVQEEVVNGETVAKQIPITRPFTFDYNTLGQLQDLGYLEPIEVIMGFEMRNANSIKDLMYACFTAGLLIEDEYASFDMSRTQVGRLLGNYMMQDNKHYQTLLSTLAEAIKSFFPEPEEKKTKKKSKKEVDPKN